MSPSRRAGGVHRAQAALLPARAPTCRPQPRPPPRRDPPLTGSLAARGLRQQQPRTCGERTARGRSRLRPLGARARGGEGCVPTEAEDRDPGCSHGGRGGRSDPGQGESAGSRPATAETPLLSGSQEPAETEARGPGADALSVRRRRSRLHAERDPESMCNPRTRWRVKYAERQTDQLGATKETRGQAQGPARPRRTPRALHLSRTRPAARECGERGARGRYKGWARA